MKFYNDWSEFVMENPVISVRWIKYDPDRPPEGGKYMLIIFRDSRDGTMNHPWQVGLGYYGYTYTMYAYDPNHPKPTGRWWVYGGSGSERRNAEVLYYTPADGVAAEMQSHLS